MFDGVLEAAPAAVGPDVAGAEVGDDNAGPPPNSAPAPVTPRVRSEFPETWLWSDYVAG